MPLRVQGEGITLAVERPQRRTEQLSEEPQAEKVLKPITPFDAKGLVMQRRWAFGLILYRRTHRSATVPDSHRTSPNVDRPRTGAYAVTALLYLC